MNCIYDVIQVLLRSGLTQVQLAERSGISQSRISRWSRRGKAAGAANDALKLLALAKGISAGDEKAPADSVDA